MRNRRGGSGIQSLLRSAASNPRTEADLDRHRSQQRLAFVGRAGELGQLQAAFEAATDRHGALIMLVGEPGIGKTALCQQLANYVGMQGGLSLVGHCYPEGSPSLPYQPFVEAVESYARERDADTLQAEIGSGLDAVARLAPSIRIRLQVELAAPENPEDERLRLLSGLLDCLRSIGATRPLLLVLEDLHDADRGTLDVLVYLARHLAGAPLLIVGTYRDVEVDRAYPLASALAELRRVSQFERMHLGELSLDEVQRLMASSSQQAIPRPLDEAVYRRSGGNALFAHELLRYLVSERLVEEHDGALRRVGEESLAGRMPEGLRDVVGRRLSRLSPEANQVLSIASVVGREFDLDILRRVATRSDDELESALEEAADAGLVEERRPVGGTISYRFSHAFFQQTLYDEILAPRRIRLHRQIARVLEEVHARRLEEHAAELADHYAFSSDASDLATAVQYCEVAASRANEVFAYGEAARQLERALAVQDLVDPEDQGKQCDLLLGLGEAFLSAGESERVTSHVAPDALALADVVGDRGRAFHACRLALDSLRWQGAVPFLPEYVTWAERGRDFADVDSIQRVHADLALATARAVQGRPNEARAFQLESLELARQHADRETLFRSAFILIWAIAPRYWQEQVHLMQEAARWPREGYAHSFGTAVRLRALRRGRYANGWNVRPNMHRKVAQNAPTSTATGACITSLPETPDVARVICAER